jgi:hypothetical protein
MEVEELVIQHHQFNDPVVGLSTGQVAQVSSIRQCHDKKEDCS